MSRNRNACPCAPETLMAPAPLIWRSWPRASEPHVAELLKMTSRKNSWQLVEVRNEANLYGCGTCRWSRLVAGCGKAYGPCQRDNHRRDWVPEEGHALGGSAVHQNDRGHRELPGRGLPGPSCSTGNCTAGPVSEGRMTMARVRHNTVSDHMQAGTATVARTVKNACLVALALCRRCTLCAEHRHGIQAKHPSGCFPQSRLMVPTDVHIFCNQSSKWQRQNGNSRAGNRSVVSKSEASNTFKKHRSTRGIRTAPC